MCVNSVYCSDSAVCAPVQCYNNINFVLNSVERRNGSSEKLHFSKRSIYITRGYRTDLGSTPRIRF